MQQNISNSTTAVLLFNYSEKQRLSLKSLAKGISAAAVENLIGKLNKQSKKLAKKSGLPFYQFNANSKFSFAEQLHSAYQNLFELGYSSVIGIANDCPSLKSQDLLNAANELKRNDFVFGPAKDGGVYLLGVNKNQLSKSDFTELDWQTENLYRSLSVKVNELGLSSISFSKKSDMDSAAEFKKAFQSHFSFLTCILSQLASFGTSFFITNDCLETKTHFSYKALRAPPFA